MRRRWQRRCPPKAAVLSPGGTDLHPEVLSILNVFAKGVRGKEAESALDRAFITANKNAIPFDTNPPLNPSGMRFSGFSRRYRGFKEAEMEAVGSLIAKVLENPSSEENLAEVRRKVNVLTERFPLYAWKFTSQAAK